MKTRGELIIVGVRDSVNKDTGNISQTIYGLSELTMDSSFGLKGEDYYCSKQLVLSKDFQPGVYSVAFEIGSYQSKEGKKSSVRLVEVNELIKPIQI